MDFKFNCLALIILFQVSHTFSMQLEPRLSNLLNELSNVLDILKDKLLQERKGEKKYEQIGKTIKLPLELQLEVLKKIIPTSFGSGYNAEKIVNKSIIEAVNFVATQSKSKEEFTAMLYEIADLIKAANPEEKLLFRAFVDAFYDNAKNVMIVIALADKTVLTQLYGDQKTMLMWASEIITDIPIRLKQQQNYLNSLLNALDTLKDNLDLNSIVNAHAPSYYNFPQATALILAVKSDNSFAVELLLNKASEWGILKETLEAKDKKGKTAIMYAEELKNQKLQDIIKSYYQKTSLPVTQFEVISPTRKEINVWNPTLTISINQRSLEDMWDFFNEREERFYDLLKTFVNEVNESKKDEATKTFNELMAKSMTMMIALKDFKEQLNKNLSTLKQYPDEIKKITDNLANFYKFIETEYRKINNNRLKISYKNQEESAKLHFSNEILAIGKLGRKLIDIYQKIESDFGLEK